MPVKGEITPIKLLHRLVLTSVWLSVPHKTGVSDVVTRRAGRRLNGWLFGSGTAIVFWPVFRLAFGTAQKHAGDDENREATCERITNN